MRSQSTKKPTNACQNGWRTQLIFISETQHKCMRCIMQATSRSPAASAARSPSVCTSGVTDADGTLPDGPVRASFRARARGFARLGADAGCYSFIAVDVHHLLLAGLWAHSPDSPGSTGLSARKSVRLPPDRQALRNNGLAFRSANGMNQNDAHLEGTASQFRIRMKIGWSVTVRAAPVTGLPTVSRTASISLRERPRSARERTVLSPGGFQMTTTERRAPSNR